MNDYYDIESYILWNKDFIKISKYRIDKKYLIDVYNNKEYMLNKQNYIRFVYLEKYLLSINKKYSNIIKVSNDYKKFRVIYSRWMNIWKIKIKWNKNKIKFLR